MSTALTTRDLEDAEPVSAPPTPEDAILLKIEAEDDWLREHDEEGHRTKRKVYLQNLTDLKEQRVARRAETEERLTVLGPEVEACYETLFQAMNDYLSARSALSATRADYDPVARAATAQGIEFDFVKSYAHRIREDGLRQLNRSWLDAVVRATP